MAGRRPSSSSRGQAGGASRVRVGASARSQEPFGKGASNRAFWPLALFALVALIFFVRLVWLQIIVAPEFQAQAQAARTGDTTTIQARRGTIYDRNGRALAISVDATDIYANPQKVTDVEAAAAQLSEVLGGEVDAYREKLTQDGTFVYIRRQADTEVADELRERGIDGIEFQDSVRREYPYASVAGQVIGFCNIDGEGISGLELYYDDILKGTDGYSSVEKGLNGIPMPDGAREEVQAIDGQDIMISIDIDLQDVVEQRLLQCQEDLTAGGGSCVIMDGGSGEIYAAASLPLFNPADTSVVEEGATSLKCVTNAFEPGSVFKTVSAMALLENEAMSPDDELFCPAEIEADGYKVSDAHDRDDETMTLRQIIDQSSNVGISLAVENMGFDKLYEKILAYNLNECTGVDYPGEASGYLLDFASWSKIQAYNVTFGQGVSVTPLQIVRFYGALVNDGVECTPHFLIAKPQTGEVPEYATEDVVENKEAIATMTDMLRTVVTDGTGKAAAIEGFNVAGKTSTAEIADEGGGYKKGVYNLCFTGFLAGSSSQLVCFVGANDVPWQASVTDAFKDIMSSAIDLFKISPE